MRWSARSAGPAGWWASAGTVAGDIRKEAQELLAGGYGPITAYVPQGDR
ncbi:hypothetical protein [Streptomyces rochei]